MVGENIIFLRKRNGLTQEALSEKINVSRQTVAKWERGESEPDCSSLMRLSSLFDVKHIFVPSEIYFQSSSLIFMDSLLKDSSLNLPSLYDKVEAFSKTYLTVALSRNSSSILARSSGVVFQFVFVFIHW